MLHEKVRKTWHEEQRSLSGGSELTEQTLAKKTRTLMKTTGLPNISTGEIIFKSGNFVFLKGQFLMDVSTLVNTRCF